MNIGEMFMLIQFILLKKVMLKNTGYNLIVSYREITAYLESNMQAFFLIKDFDQSHFVISGF